MALYIVAAGVLLLLRVPLVGAEGRSYVAAVYEHAVVLSPNPREAVDRGTALKHMQRNLDVFEEQAAVAAQKGAQIVVFPEDAIQGFNFTRASIASYLETVPDPRVVTWSPCADPGRFPNTEVLQQLSCMALKNGLFIVANMPDCQPCNRSTDAHCPLDSRYQFNTDVVFSHDGTLVARYHKQNLYFEAAFDVPPEVEYITFTTPFAGRFGVFTCFDILFRDPAVTLVQEMGVRQLVYPTAWMNQLPLLAAVQIQRSFSYAAGVTLLAANIRAAQLGMTGSGIYSPWHALYHHDAAGEEGRLLVGTVPVLDPTVTGESLPAPAPFSGHAREGAGSAEPDWDGTWSRGRMTSVEQGRPEAESCRMGSSECSEDAVPENMSSFTATMMYDNFTFVPLRGVGGNVTVCDGSLCCHLLFRRSNASETELFALGAFRGLHVVHGTYYLEVCALVKCTSTDPASCGGEIEHSQTVVDFRLEGTFSTRNIFPGILGSGMSLDRPDESAWEGESRFHMSRRGMPTGLVTAVLYGRVYEP